MSKSAEPKQFQVAAVRAILNRCQDLVWPHDPDARVRAQVTASAKGLIWFIYCDTRKLAKAPRKEEPIGGMASDPVTAGQLFEKSLAVILKRNAEVAARRKKAA